MTLAQTLLGLGAAGPFLCAALIALNRRHWRWAAVALPLLTLMPLLLLAMHFPAPTEIVFGEIIPGVAVGFRTEVTGLIFACVVAVLWPVSMLYTLDYLDANRLAHPRRLCFLFSIAIGCTFGVAFAGDLLTMLVFYEFLTFSTYPLVTHRADAEARRAGHIYLGFLLGSSLLLLLPAVIWTAASYGTLAFEDGGIMHGRTPPPALLALFAFGIGKAALMPAHRWLPSAMVAPVPVSALLHAVAVVKCGVFAIIKILVGIFGLDAIAASGAADWLVYAAGLSVIAASVIALRQDNLKRRLAYSTVSQLACITMGAALLKPAIIGAVLHLAAHAFGKITLFFAAGAISTRTGKYQISELAGVGRLMPMTMLCFGIAAVSLIGLPPTAGFASKWYLLDGALQAPHFFAVAVLLVSTLLNAAYFVPIVYQAFAAPPEESSGKPFREAPPGMIAAMALTAGAGVALFFAGGAISEILRSALQ